MRKPDKISQLKLARAGRAKGCSTWPTMEPRNSCTKKAMTFQASPEDLLLRILHLMRLKQLADCKTSGLLDHGARSWEGCSRESVAQPGSKADVSIQLLTSWLRQEVLRLQRRNERCCDVALPRTWFNWKPTPPASVFGERGTEYLPRDCGPNPGLGQNSWPRTHVAFRFPLSLLQLPSRQEDAWAVSENSLC